MHDNENGWDWPFIIYAGTVWLNRAEEEVWKMRPRKLFALLNVHYDIKRREYGQAPNTTESKPVDGYIDNIPGW